MRVSYNWLREYVPIDLSPAELGEKLTMAGLEVEEIIDFGASYRSLKIGKILEIEPHPQADRLLLCRLQLADGEVTVVTAAQNLRRGDLVPVALPGVTLPDGRKIEIAEFHGVRSQGMLCSEEELGLARKSTGIMVLPEGTALQANLDTVLGLDDHVLVLELTPNRADCYGMLGIAREVAAITGVEVKLPDLRVEEATEPIEEFVSIEVQDEELAPRYAGRVLLDLKLGESPLWLKARLLAAGMRPINNMVDLTNYVMLELNQPLHAFDLQQMKDQKVVVRSAREKEVITTLDDQERTLTRGQLVIADAVQAQCIAGVMGSGQSEVAEATKTVFLESAYFSPVSIRRTAQFFALRSEAAIRFGKGLDPETVPLALDRVAHLAQKLGIARVAKGVIDLNSRPFTPRKIRFRPERINGLLGTKLDSTEMFEIFKRLNFKLEEQPDGTCDLLPPSYRLDIEGEADLAEEVARIYGYDRIPATYPAAKVIGQLTPRQEFTEATRQLLLGCGLSEIKTYSFHGESMFERLNIPADHPLREAVRMMVPLSEEGSLMRTTLLTGVIEALSYNARRNQHDLQVFEIAHVYHPTTADALPEEPEHLAGGLSGKMFTPAWNQNDREVDFYDGKGLLETIFTALRVEKVTFRRGEHPVLHPGRTAILEYAGEPLGIVGEIHPQIKVEFDLVAPVVLFEINLEKLWQAACKEVVQVKALPKFPPILRDLALVLPEKVKVEEVMAVFHENGQEKLEAVQLFDVYQGDKIPAGYRSIAFSLTFRLEERTLKDDEVNAIMERIIEAATSKFGAQVRTA
ncbi:MAG: phenylalanine--tRNA ligase subunit beta [Firmicutes bacterium]|nr:phenylalanine--tRNA ligase subunit beta [Bacillota bacterium]